jgi:hypothetical protein
MGHSVCQQGRVAIRTGYSASTILVVADSVDRRLQKDSAPRPQPSDHWWLKLGSTCINYIRDKYLDAPIGVLLAVGSAALEFAMRLPTELWPDAPIVFAAADEGTVIKVIDAVAARNFTGRTLRFSLTKSVDVARAVVPGLKQIALVGDPLETQPFRRHFKEELPLAIPNLALIDLTGLPLGEVKKRVAALPEDSAIIYTAMTTDISTDYFPPEAVEAIAEVANRRLGSRLAV